MPLTEEDKQEIMEAFGKTLDLRRNIADNQHKIHHDFVQTLIDKEKRKQERIEAVKTQVAGWGTILVIVSFIGGLGKAILEWFKLGAPPPGS